MTDPRDPRLKRQLDAFTVPDLPGDFADRMVALAMAAGEATPAAAPAPAAKPRRLRLWLGGMALAGAGFASFSAAAMGYLGEPLRNVVHRVPIVHRLVERLAPRHHHPLPGPLAPPPAQPATVSAPPVAVASPAPAVASPTAMPPVPLAGPGLRRAAAAAAIWQARHPDMPLPRRLAVPPAAIRAARPWAAPTVLSPAGERPAPRLRLLRERRAARALGTGAPPVAAPPPASPPPLVAPPAPAIQPAPAHPEAAAARPWRWWEQAPGEPPRRGRWQRRQLEGATPPASAPAPGVEHPEARPPAAEAPRAHPAEPRPHAQRAPRLPRPHGGGRRRL